MKCRVIAAGTRMPGWVSAGFAEYQKRLKKPFSVELHEIPVAVRGGSSSTTRAIEREGRAMLAAIGREDFVVALEVAGKPLSTEALAQWLQTRMREGGNICFLIGGPDGLMPECCERAGLRWSLSALTFPHGLVRVMLAEQLYRAASLIAGHPYHRA